MLQRFLQNKLLLPYIPSDFVRFLPLLVLNKLCYISCLKECHMNYFKFGSRWSDTGAHDRKIDTTFANAQAVFIGADRIITKTKYLRFNSIRPGDRIAITDGLTITGVAIIKPFKYNKVEYLKYSQKMPLKYCRKRFLRHMKIHRSLIEGNGFTMKDFKFAVGFPAIVKIFDKDEEPKEFIRGSFCRIVKPEITDYIDQMIEEKYKTFFMDKKKHKTFFNPPIFDLFKRIHS